MLEDEKNKTDEIKKTVEQKNKDVFDASKYEVLHDTFKKDLKGFKNDILTIFNNDEKLQSDCSDLHEKVLNINNNVLPMPGNSYSLQITRLGDILKSVGQLAYNPDHAKKIQSQINKTDKAILRFKNEIKKLEKKRKGYGILKASVPGNEERQLMSRCEAKQQVLVRLETKSKQLEEHKDTLIKINESLSNIKKLVGKYGLDSGEIQLFEHQYKIKEDQRIQENKEILTLKAQLDAQNQTIIEYKNDMGALRKELLDLTTQFNQSKLEQSKLEHPSNILSQSFLGQTNNKSFKTIPHFKKYYPDQFGDIKKLAHVYKETEDKGEKQNLINKIVIKLENRISDISNDNVKKISKTTITPKNKLKLLEFAKSVAGDLFKSDDGLLPKNLKLVKYFKNYEPKQITNEKLSEGQTSDVNGSLSNNVSSK